MTARDQILHDACTDVLATIRFGNLVDRNVPTSVLARRLNIAADEWAAAESAEVS